ncbi:WD40-repeat-containing domain protein [Cyathus striatus]|nr:WD40-repeat-containing domain protein [Cyathus striatus]
MIQTGLIQSAHSDLITDASYDFYGLRLATCSLDQRCVFTIIKVWQLDETNNTWTVEDDWKAHDAAVSKVAWAHPEFGSVIASGSFDRTVKVWEQSSPAGSRDSSPPSGANGPGGASSQSRWIERVVFSDAKGTVRGVEFAPHHFGLKLATLSSDNHLRIYECLEQPSLSTWQLSEEVDVGALPITASPASLSRQHTMALATPTQTNATLEAAPANLVAQALQQGLQQGQGRQQGQGVGNREADGGWSLSWCKERYWGEIIACAAGTSGIVKVIQLSPSRRPSTLLTLDPSPASSPPSSLPSSLTTQGEASDVPVAAAPITSVAWAPSCGRSYHLIATGGRDGHVRIWKVKNPEENSDEENVAPAEPKEEDGRWTATVVADFDHHKSAVGRVEWNITGTVLSSAGNDGRVRLWKATSGNVWRPAGSIGVEQAEEGEEGKDKDIEMES